MYNNRKCITKALLSTYVIFIIFNKFDVVKNILFFVKIYLFI